MESSCLAPARSLPLPCTCEEYNGSMDYLALCHRRCWECCSGCMRRRQWTPPTCRPLLLSWTPAWQHMAFQHPPASMPLALMWPSSWGTAFRYASTAANETAMWGLWYPQVVSGTRSSPFSQDSKVMSDIQDVSAMAAHEHANLLSHTYLETARFIWGITSSKECQSIDSL